MIKNKKKAKQLKGKHPQVIDLFEIIS
ncbi:uncharacterized protein METZ01_LOCUS272083 [marine metagenome]|uniref:Uncharacterized protein n=1 Tax=marine metagenome TaxID=408172 RepID=A0A382K4Z1_9ZZZZ